MMLIEVDAWHQPTSTLSGDPAPNPLCLHFLPSMFCHKYLKHGKKWRAKNGKETRPGHALRGRRLVRRVGPGKRTFTRASRRAVRAIAATREIWPGERCWPIGLARRPRRRCRGDRPPRARKPARYAVRIRLAPTGDSNPFALRKNFAMKFQVTQFLADRRLSINFEGQSSESQVKGSP